MPHIYTHKEQIPIQYRRLAYRQRARGKKILGLQRRKPCYVTMCRLPSDGLPAGQNKNTEKKKKKITAKNCWQE
jgi:hypothetical protein